MSEPVVWILALASAALLVCGGFTLAVARLRGRVMARRRQAARLGAQLEGQAADPFGELLVIGDQLRKIQERLGRAEDVAGLPVQRAAGSAAGPPRGSAPVTVELEQDLDLFKKEVYEKTRRIDALLAEKQVLGEKIVELQSALATAPAAGAPAQRPKATESSQALVDVLQQEADELRAQIGQRDALLASLEKSDTSGLVREVGRIRAELVQRNEEVAALQARLAQSGQSARLQARVEALEQEKEALAARALDTAGQLRQASERIAELEQSMVSRQAVAYAGATRAPQPPPLAPPTRSPPPVPMPSTTPPPRVASPPPRRSLPPEPQPAEGPVETTVRTAPPKMPPPRRDKQRHTGSIFPPPRSKKDLLD